MKKEDIKKEILNSEDLTDKQKIKMLKALEEEYADETNEDYNEKENILLG